MVTFDHRDAGSDPQLWHKVLGRCRPTAVDLGRLRRLIVVAAHPDDETLGAGGLLATAAALGAIIDVIVATDGEASHPHSTTHSAADLAQIRQREVQQAVSAVAPDAQLHLLHLPDGRLSDHLTELTEEIRFHLRTPELSGTLLVTPWIADGHPDHHAAGIAGYDAAAAGDSWLLQYPIWAWHWGDPAAEDVPFERLRSLELDGPALSTKRDALRQHRSQTAPLSELDGDETLLPAGLQTFFDADREYFVVPGPEDLHPTKDPLSETTRDTTGSDRTSLDREFFDDFYGDRSDPWGFADRWYEERKRALTMASLPRRRFRSAFEPGCSVGVLTAQLAVRCDRVLAADISEQPLREAARRLQGVDNVELRQLRVPQDWPTADYDLIVLSEVGYYCSTGDLDRLIELVLESLTADGVLIACHWRHQVNAYPLRGDEVHQRLRQNQDLALLSEHVEADFRLDVLVRPPVVSVAAAEGLA